MKTDAEHSPHATPAPAIMRDARALQATEGARMIRGAGRAIANAVARLAHVHPVRAGHSQLG